MLVARRILETQDTTTPLRLVTITEKRYMPFAWQAMVMLQTVGSMNTEVGEDIVLIPTFRGHINVALGHSLHGQNLTFIRQIE